MVTSEACPSHPVCMCVCAYVSGCMWEGVCMHTCLVQSWLLQPPPVTSSPVLGRATSGTQPRKVTWLFPGLNSCQWQHERESVRECVCEFRRGRCFCPPFPELAQLPLISP